MSFRHLPSRREMLIGSGALFACTQMPRLARAEGRDPRMLVIVLEMLLRPDWVVASNPCEFPSC